MINSFNKTVQVHRREPESFGEDGSYRAIKPAREVWIRPHKLTDRGFVYDTQTSRSIGYNPGACGRTIYERHLAEKFACLQHREQRRPGPISTLNANRAVFNEKDGPQGHVLVQDDLLAGKRF